MYRLEDIAPRLGRADTIQSDFIPNGDWGLKVFTESPNRWDAFCAYYRQLRASRFGLAPSANRFLVVRDSAGRDLYWGYETEIADLEPFAKYLGHDYRDCSKAEMLKDFRPMRDELKHQLSRVSLDALPANDIYKNHYLSDRLVTHPTHHVLGGDLHAANMGMIRGSPVCIDFGFHSVLTNVNGKLGFAFDRVEWPPRYTFTPGEHNGRTDRSARCHH